MPEAFNRNSVSLTTTNITDAYQAPNVADANRAVVMSCMVANKKTSGPVPITLSISDSSNTLISTIASTVSVPANASIEAVVNKLVLKRGEKIRATAGESNQLEITVSSLEIT